MNQQPQKDKPLDEDTNGFILFFETTIVQELFGVEA